VASRQWSLLAVDPTRDYFGLAVAGFALFLAPWLAAFADDEAAWAAWIPGFIATALGVAGYLRGESLDFAQTVRNEADARYGQRFRWLPQRPSIGAKPAEFSGLYGESAIFRHFKSESATENRNLQPAV
jgi:hypothetical protein